MIEKDYPSFNKSMNILDFIISISKENQYLEKKKSSGEFDTQNTYQNSDKPIINHTDSEDE